MAKRYSKPLKQLLSREKEIAGITKPTHGSKKIESPGGQTRYVPAYTVDSVAQADVTVTRFDFGRWANSNWNWDKTTQERVKLDTTFRAAPVFNRRKRRVVDKT